MTHPRIIRSNLDQATPVLIQDVGYLVPAAGGQIEISDEQSDLIRASVSLDALLQDSAYVGGTDTSDHTLILNDGTSDIDPSRKPAFFNSVNVVVNSYTFPPTSTNSTSYLTVGTFVFDGTTILTATPEKYLVVGGIVTADQIGIRVFDVTNATTIAEINNATAVYPSIITLPGVGTPSLDAAIWEVQVRREAGVGAETVRAASLTIEFV